MIIDSIGNIGIGTTNSENYKLNVNGSIFSSNNYIGDGSLLTNLKLENQSNFVYPPSSLTSLSTNITSTIYGNGIYTISASSTTAAKDAFYCFNKILITNDWSPSGSPYSGTSGAYTTTPVYSTIVSGSNYYGEWIQLYYDKGFAANTFTITGISGSNAKCPSNFILAGSTNQQNWVLLSTQTEIIDYTTTPSKTFSIYNYTTYNYYRLIITKTISDTSLSISEISFTGTQNTSFTNLDSYISTVYNTNEKQFPPRLYDYATSETTAINEIFNCIPSSPYKQTINLNNVIYTIYSSTTSTLKSLLFDNTSNNIAKWAATQYNSANGNYSANTNYIANNTTNKGDWLIIKFPFKIILTAFKFYQDSTNPTTAPGLWKCYGSNDGVNFIEIIDASNITTVASYSGYTYTKTLPFIFDIPYLYIGWVFYKLSGLGTYLSIVELQIFGKQDNSISTLDIQNVISINQNNIQRFPLRV
jgi:hypothetical protein